MKSDIKKKLSRAFFVLYSIIVVACQREADMYDRAGYSAPRQAQQNPEVPPYQNGVAQNPAKPVAPYYGQQPATAVPYGYPPYQYYQAPASRYYSNPYNFAPPAQVRPPYYDSDQYYVPPINSGYGQEIQQSNQSYYRVND